MITLPVHDQSGNEVSSYELDPATIAASINKQLLHDVVVMYEANKRQGTVRTKSRGEVAGTTQKMYRQKGTGRARAGSKRSPVRVGGGHTFAKRPKDWGYRLPKKAVKLATRMALLSKFEDGQVKVVDKIDVDQPKTKVIAEMLKALGLVGGQTLLSIPEHNSVLWKSCRNIDGFRVSPVSDLNAYDLLHQRMLLVTTDALDAMKQTNGAE